MKLTKFVISTKLFKLIYVFYITIQPCVLILFDSQIKMICIIKMKKLNFNYYIKDVFKYYIKT